MLKKYSLKALQKAINHTLQQDDQSLRKLQALEGKILEMVITPLQVHFFIQFKKGTLLLLSQYQGPVDTLIQSSPLGLIRLSLLPASKARSLFNDTVQITGDMELGQQVKQLFDDLDLDWEGHLAHFTGDVVAYQIGSLVRKGIQFKNQFNFSLCQNVREYLQEECRVFPSSNELNDFYEEVDLLSLQMDRLKARINQLMSTHEIH